MYTELLTHPLRKNKHAQWQQFLCAADLVPDEGVCQTVLVYDNGEIIAAGSRQDNLLKCIAVSPDHQGEGLLATVLTALRQAAFDCGHRHLFLYTKPQNEYLFTSLLFYPVAKTDSVLLMEDQKEGVSSFIRSLPKADCQNAGAVVVNCDPFTSGHRYLIETAAGQCEHLYVFVLSEDRGHFAADDRLKMVQAGTADLTNVSVLPTGPYLISSATFPTYFLKDRDKAPDVHCALDIKIFTSLFAPYFHITHRFVGSEPLSPLTNRYNEALQNSLPHCGIEVHILPRKEQSGTPISASAVRAAWAAGDMDTVRKLVPPTTFDHLLKLQEI